MLHFKTDVRTRNLLGRQFGLENMGGRKRLKHPLPVAAAISHLLSHFYKTNGLGNIIHTYIHNVLLAI